MNGMEQLIRFAAAALLGTAVCLLLKKSNPELQVPLAAAVCTFVLWGGTALLRPLREFLQKAEGLSALSGAYFSPVVKCVAIGILSRGAAELCRDGGQSAMAGAVELGGTAAALYVSLPLLTALLELLEKLL